MDIQGFIQCVERHKADDAFKPELSAAQWQLVGSLLQHRELRSGELLIRQGDASAQAYLLDQGQLQVFMNSGSPGSHRISVLRPGAIVGEPALFHTSARMANVEAMVPSQVWAFPAAKLKDLSQRDPGAAQELLRAAGAVMAVRMRMNLQRGLPWV